MVDIKRAKKPNFLRGSDKVKVAIVGATGYVGFEIIRLLLSHPRVVVSKLYAGSSMGLCISEIYPYYLDKKKCDLKILDVNNIDFTDIDAVFLCLPHNCAQDIVPKIPERVKIIDLSADFRIKNIDKYQEGYGEHKNPHFVTKFVYGLTELYSDEVKSANFVACPGCYATSILLPLLPLVKSGLIDVGNIIIDAKSGISGAGKTASNKSLFYEVNESIRIYDVLKHRHTIEIEQELSIADSSKQDIFVQFVPNLIPVNSGILSCIYVNLQKGNSGVDIVNELQRFYKDSNFVFIDNHKACSTRSVIGTNYCYIGIFPTTKPNLLLITSVLDNLIKGAAGQAIQNFNLMHNFHETTCLINAST